MKTLIAVLFIILVSTHALAASKTEPQLCAELREQIADSKLSYCVNRTCVHDYGCAVLRKDLEREYKKSCRRKFK